MYDQTWSGGSWEFSGQVRGQMCLREEEVTCRRLWCHGQCEPTARALNDLSLLCWCCVVQRPGAGLMLGRTANKPLWCCVSLRLLHLWPPLLRVHNADLALLPLVLLVVSLLFPPSIYLHTHFNQYYFFLLPVHSHPLSFFFFLFLMTYLVNLSFVWSTKKR